MEDPLRRRDSRLETTAMITMKKLMKTAILVGGAILASQAGFAQNTFSTNHLYLGFQNQAGGGTEDYIIDLGPASGIVGGSSVIDLSSKFALTDFNAVLGSSSSLFGGVVGGYQSSITADIYFTQLRSGGTGLPSVAGSSLTATTSRQGIDAAVSTLNQVAMPTAVQGSVLDTTKSWETYVEPTLNSSTFVGNAPNPDSPVGPSTVLYEDLWYSQNGTLTGHSSYAYQGYFTLDLTGSNPKLTFTPMNAPASLTPPVIASVSKTGTMVTVVCSNTVPTFNYQLQYTASLNPASWHNVGSSQVASGMMLTNADTTATDPQRFYRVQGH